MHPYRPGTQYLCDDLAVAVAIPSGVGGVAEAIGRGLRALPLLNGAPKVVPVPVGRRGAERVGVRSAIRDVTGIRHAASTCRLFHFHPSLRARALGRDMALHAVARGSGCHTVVQLHGWSESLARRTDHSSVMRDFLHRTLFTADVVLTVAQAHRRRLLAWGMGADRVKVVCNPYDPDALGGDRGDHAPTVLFMGRLVAHKRVKLLIDAFARLAHRLTHARLEIAGDGPQLAPLVRWVAQRGLEDRVTFLGWVSGPAKRAALGRATVLALPSAEEGAPLAVVEALAAGVCVAACRVGALAEIVGPAGRLLPPSAHAATWAGALEALLRHPVDVNVDVDRFAPEAVAGQWLGTYRDVMAGT